MKLRIFIIFIFIVQVSEAVKITTLVEFMSFSCPHCYQSEGVVKRILSTGDVKYVPIVMVQNVNQGAISSIYTACQLSGIGWQFRDAYFNAIFVEGYPGDSPLTVKYVLDKIGVDSSKILEIAKSQKVKDKLTFDMQMIQQYHISSTPTFVINGDSVLEGDTALNGFINN